MPALSKPTNGINSDYANRIGLLFDAFNNGNYNFPATQVPSADANTLDDYEEGTFTPSLGGNTTYNTQLGTYTKIGREVMIRLFLSINVIGTGSTALISGLPFSIATNSSGSVGYFNSAAANVVFVSLYGSSGTTMSISTANAAAATSATPTASFMGSSTQLQASFNYNV